MADVLLLNVGCGLKYLDGFVNIDGSGEIRTDKIIDVGKESLLDHFEPNTIGLILSHDFIEHHYHWDAVKILKDFYLLLKHEGSIEIKVPNVEIIINSQLPIDEKIILLYGGQDIPQGSMDESRKHFPQYFCHKYGWTQARMASHLSKIGFSQISHKNFGNDFITYAKKS
jgi:hypothetical protein